MISETVLPDLYDLNENPYDRFAAVYNSHWGSNSLHFLPLYERQALNALPECARILDLCCGTGQFSRVLTRRGFQVVGVDSSAGMLNFARNNVPEAEFVCSDVRNFRTPIKFDAAVCVYDSLNHLLTIEDLTSAFETVRHCLSPHGLFALDMNMPAKYRNSWRGEFTVEESDSVYEIVARVDHPQRLATLEAYSKSNRHDDPIRFLQTWYSQAEISETLRITGFGEIETFSLSDENPSDPERMLFVCRRC